MRTIKFRGKTKDGCWVFGDLLTNHKTPEILAYKGQYEVEKETIGQYTGLVDKNGKEIYEGDYVEVQQSGFGGVITWHSHGYFYIKELYKFKYNEESDCISLGEFIDNPKRKVTIVGNIHDNPELIKGE